MHLYLNIFRGENYLCQSLWTKQRNQTSTLQFSHLIKCHWTFLIIQWPCLKTIYKFTKDKIYCEFYWCITWKCNYNKQLLFDFVFLCYYYIFFFNFYVSIEQIIIQQLTVQSIKIPIRVMKMIVCMICAYLMLFIYSVRSL